jgi:hypothetical protein
MGTFPTRWHKIVIVGWVMLTMIANMGTVFEEGLSYALGYILGMVAMATLVVFFASLVIGKLRQWNAPPADA